MPYAVTEFSQEYDSLLAIAGRYKRFSNSDTLPAMGLVHEAWIRLKVDGRVYVDRAHFLATAASVMRQILVDYVRGQNRDKRGGDWVRITTDATELAAEQDAVDVEVIHDALQRLEKWDPRQARIVELRFFAGMNTNETAELMAISERTVKREWSMARAWLQRQLSL